MTDEDRFQKKNVIRCEKHLNRYTETELNILYMCYVMVTILHQPIIIMQYTKIN